MPQKTIEVPAGYAVIPIDLLCEKSIPARAKLLYAHLWYLKNVKHKRPRTLRELASITGCGLSRTTTFVNLLKQKKWISDFPTAFFDDKDFVDFIYS